MKLSEKIQEALRQQQEINLSDPAVQKRLAAQWGYVPADAQPAPSFADAYQGAMEEVAIWKRRALEAEDLNRKFIAEINGPTHMGEPAQPAPSVPELSDDLIEAIESRAEQSYRRHHGGIRGQQVTPADALSWHIIHATRSVLVEAMETSRAP
jgi:hypothetical protein